MTTSSLPSFVKIPQAVLEKKLKIWKVWDGLTDWRYTLTIAHLSLRLRWAETKQRTKNTEHLRYCRKHTCRLSSFPPCLGCEALYVLPAGSCICSGRLSQNIYTQYLSVSAYPSVNIPNLTKWRTLCILFWTKGVPIVICTGSLRPAKIGTKMKLRVCGFKTEGWTTNL